MFINLIVLNVSSSDMKQNMVRLSLFFPPYSDTDSFIYLIQICYENKWIADHIAVNMTS